MDHPLPKDYGELHVGATSHRPTSLLAPHSQKAAQFYDRDTQDQDSGTGGHETRRYRLVRRRARSREGVILVKRVSEELQSKEAGSKDSNVKTGEVNRMIRRIETK